MTKITSARKVVMVSFIMDVLDVITNLIVASLTGSAVVGELAFYLEAGCQFVMCKE